jgi:Sigma-70, region 4
MPNPAQGQYGQLHEPQKRQKLLRRYAHLTLSQAAEKLGVKKERARQLYRLYSVPRTKPAC